MKKLFYILLILLIVISIHCFNNDSSQTDSGNDTISEEDNNQEEQDNSGNDNQDNSQEIIIFQNTDIIESGELGFDFSNVLINNESSPVTFKIINAGNSDLIINSIFFSSGEVSQFIIDTNNTQFSIESNSETSFKVTFNPTSEGLKSVILTISNNDIDEGNYEIILKGTGDDLYGWTKALGSSSDEYGREIIKDSNHNIYVCGNFRDSIDFDFSIGEDIKTSNGNDDIFVTKINNDGTYGWTKTFGGIKTDRVCSISIDSDDNVYIIGQFVGTIDFDWTTGEDIEISNENGGVFVTRINNDGSYGWTNAFCSDLGVMPMSIESDSNDNIYITGGFYGSADFDHTTGEDIKTSNGDIDIFITKYDKNGNYIWTETIGGNEGDCGRSIAVDNTSNIYITGTFGNTVDFDFTTGTDEHTNNGSWSIFILKINNNQTYGWTKSISGSVSGDYGHPSSITIDSNSNIFITGGFSGSLDFDPTVETDIISSNGDDDIFITKINNDGTYGWTKTIGAAGNDRGSSIHTDTFDNIFIIGDFVGTVDFDPGIGVDEKVSINESDLYITKLSSDGSYFGTKTIISSWVIYGYSIFIDSNNHLFITGGFTQTTDFDPTIYEDNKTSVGNLDIFITEIYEF